MVFLELLQGFLIIRYVMLVRNYLVVPHCRGKVRDSTLEFEGVHLTQKTIFVTDSKNTFTFFLSFVVFILRLFSKNRRSSCFLGSFDGFY